MLKLGAIHNLPPTAVPPLSLRARGALLVPPQHADWLSACPADGDMLGNDRLGNCVPVAELRAIQIRRANAWGDSWAPGQMVVDRLYASLTGWDPVTGKGDNGTDTAQAMAAWASRGIAASDQVLDVIQWATVPPLATLHVRAAIAHTGPVQATLALPIAAEDVSLWSREPGRGTGWEAGTWGWHRVVLGAFDGSTMVCRTWGKDVIMHPAFWARYGIGVDVTLSRTWMDTAGLSPAGLDWEALQADMAELSPA